MKKEIYTKPEIEIIEFSLEDITTADASFNFNNGGILDGDHDHSWWG